MLFAALLVLSSVDYDVLSAAAAESAGTACPNHTEHTADCGYVEAVEGAGCTHEHDENCGYVEAVEGQPCTHSCELCSGAAEESTEEETTDTEEDLPEKQAEAEASAVGSEISSWADLQTALKTSGEYKLTCDVESTEDSQKGVLEIPAGVTVTLDLAGHKVDRSLESPLSDGQVMKVSGALTVNDSVGVGTGVITGGYGSGIDMAGAAVYVKTGGSFTLNGGSIRGNKTSADSNHATGVGVENNATFIMNGGSIRNNGGMGNGSLGGGVGADSSATVKLLGGSIFFNNSNFALK